MRYQLLALVHGRPTAQSTNGHLAGNSLPAVVDYGITGVHKRVVAVVDAGHVLSRDEVQSTASMLCAQLERAFLQHGLSLSLPELVQEA